MDELLAMFGKKQQTSDFTRLLESCPYTKTTSRRVSLTIDVEKFCKEKELDFAKIDKSVFPSELEFLFAVMHDKDGDLSFGGKFTLENKKIVYFSKTVDRIDSPDSEKTREQTYADMLAEDTFAEKEAKHLLHLFLREKRFIYAVLYYADEIYIDNTLNIRFTACAKSSKINTLRVNRKTLVDSITALFDELVVLEESYKIVSKKVDENREKHLAIAKAYDINGRKKVVEKKQKQEEQTRSQLDDEAKKLAKEAADLKLMLGQKTSENAPKADDI